MHVYINTIIGYVCTCKLPNNLAPAIPLSWPCVFRVDLTDNDWPGAQSALRRVEGHDPLGVSAGFSS